ncbi:MAG: DUF3551 domain-containing protein [Pseudorhodoplanes sp.]
MRKILVATFALACAIPALTASKPASATEYPWCAQYTGNNAGKNCGFVSQRQCLATIYGVGGFCTPNPVYLGVYGHPYGPALYRW